MSEIKISELDTGAPKGTDETPAVDTTDLTQSATGTTKKYIRSDELNFYLNAQGIVTYQAVLAGTTAFLGAIYDNGTSGVGATLTNSGVQSVLTIDGVELAVSSRVMVKNQAATSENGIYLVSVAGNSSTNWVLVRAADFDESSEIVEGGTLLVNSGTINAGLLFQEASPAPFTIGVSAITFALYTNESITLPLVVSQGGTGATTAAGARTNLGLGSMAVQDSSAVAVTGGALSGVTVSLGGSLNTNGQSIVNSLVNGNIDLTTNGAGLLVLNATQGVNAISNDPTLAADSDTVLVTQSALKSYVDTIASGFQIKQACVVASVGDYASAYANGAAGVGATLTADSVGATTIDDILLIVGNRVLFKNQASTFENGIYQLTTLGDGVTNAIFTRTTDYDDAAQILAGTLVPVISGAVNALSIWLQTQVVVTVGTDPILFITFAQPSGTYVTLATTQTITGTKTFQSGVIRLAGSTSGYTAIQPQAISSSTVLSLPNATDTLVALATTDTLTNKSISGSTNTLSNIAFTSLATATAGSILAFDAGGAAALIAPGTAGQVLTSNGIGATPTMQTGASVGVPVGTVIDFAASSAPTGYLPCDGSMSTVSRATYSGLFSVIGTTWGVGDGVTTFGIPNLSRQVAMGSGGTGTATIANFVGSVGGTEFINQTIAQLAAHDHPGSTFPGTFKATCTSGSSGAYNINPPTTAITVASQGAGADMNIIQPSAVVLKCIKY